MNGLWTQIVENLSFIIGCIAIVAGLSLLAKLAERMIPDMRKVSKARYISIVGICAAIATVLHMLDFPLLFLAPDFYKVDFSELPVLLCGFYLGPSASIACEGIKIVLKLLFKSTSTAFVGDFANFAVGCSLVLPATIIYHAHKSKHSAVLGLIIGCLCMTVFGSAFNAIYLLPKFAQLYNIPLEAIIGMGADINGRINSVTSLVLICVAPLNLLKSSVVSVLTLLLYKRVARPLFGKAT
ncbi:MAG: ECF transporter S component [Oscillospiraceae bacterium]|nr:ECF transporter S component [Oscillospiraceae bacterium]